MTAIGQTIIAEVRKIAAENSNHVYGADRCVYMCEGQPQCIMGKALFNLGYLPAAHGLNIENEAISTVLKEALDIEAAFQYLSRDSSPP